MFPRIYLFTLLLGSSLPSPHCPVYHLPSACSNVPSTVDCISVLFTSFPAITSLLHTLKESDGCGFVVKLCCRGAFGLAPVGTAIVAPLRGGRLVRASGSGGESV